MAEITIAEAVKDCNMYELACKTVRKMQLDDKEEFARAELDKAFKEIGDRGYDPEHVIASFTQKVVNEEIYNAPDELLDFLFDRSSLDELDDYESYTTPLNTLMAHEAATGGNVERSYLDISVLKPTWKNRQIETDISFADLKRNGWKSVALVTEYAVAAFKNALFKDIFDVIDAAIADGADNYINITSAMPTQAAADQIALYLQDRADGNGTIVARSKYIQAISKFTGFVSDDMINEVNRTGRLGVYDSCDLVPISSAKKLGDGTGLILDKRIFGIAGKIGSLHMKGEIKTYEVEDVNKEVIHLMWKNFTYGYAFNKDTLENVVKAVLQ